MVKYLGYCPLCDKEFEMRTESNHGRCPECGHRLSLHKEYDEEPKMYIKYRGDTPVEYLYGPSWKAMQLMMEGGYKTPEEAKAAWEREQQE